MSKHTVEQIRAHAKMLAEYEDPQICNADTAEILTAYADLLEQIERARDRVTKDATVSLCAEMARFISGRVAYDKEAISLVDRAATLQSVAHLLPRGERGGVDAGMAAALRKIAAIRWQSAAINGCAHEAAKIASADLESALAQPASPEQPAGRQGEAWRACYGDIIKSLAAMARVGAPDSWPEDAIRRDPIMEEVRRIKQALDTFNKAKPFTHPAAPMVVPYGSASGAKDYAYGYEKGRADGWNACRDLCVAAAPPAPQEVE